MHYAQKKKKKHGHIVNGNIFFRLQARQIYLIQTQQKPTQK
jgi:hypothetical protein